MIQKEITGGMTVDKGTHGYIRYKKNKQLRNTIIIAIIGVAIFVAGYLLNDNSKNNVFTIVAILMALPGAKMLVGYIVVAPYHSMDEKKYNDVCNILPTHATMLTDLVITSPEKVMNLDCMVIDERHAIGLQGKDGQDTSYIQTYLGRTIKNQGHSCEVKIMTDYSKFATRIKSLEQGELSEEGSTNRDEIVKLIKTLNV